MLPLVIIADLWSIVLKMFLKLLDIYNNICFCISNQTTLPSGEHQNPYRVMGKTLGLGPDASKVEF